MPTSSNTETNPQPPALPSFHLSSNMFPSEHRFEAWRQFTAPALSVELSEPGCDDYTFDYTGYLFNQLVFGRGKCDKMWFNRSPSKSETEASEQISLQLYTEGQARGSLENGTPLLLQSDRIVLHDLAHPCTGLATNCDVISIIIPRRLFKRHDLIYSQAPIVSWSITSSGGRVLKAIIETIWEELPHLTPTDAVTLNTGVLGLLNGLLSGHLDEENRPAVEQITLGAMQRYIKANLHRPDLSAEDLCNEYFCSRATVYRLFEHCGGLMNYIRQQRLLRCFQILKNLEPDSRQSVKDIAAQWGFTNPTSFSHLFKKQFDITPKALKSMPFSQAESSLQLSFGQDLGWLQRSME